MGAGVGTAVGVAAGVLEAARRAAVLGIGDDVGVEGDGETAAPIALRPRRPPAIPSTSFFIA